MDSPNVHFISECYVKPETDATHESKLPVYLGMWDLPLLSAHYNQKGLLFQKPSVLPPNPQDFIQDLLHRLKRALSLTLVHFYSLAGRLVTDTTQTPHSCCVYVDCNDGPGVKFIHASLDSTVSDILSPDVVPSVIRSFFDMNGVVNHDGHDLPLFSVQVTELVDGVFIGCTMNHCVVDGTSFWHFFNAWSEIFQQLERNPSIGGNDDIAISVKPNHKRWWPDGYGPCVNLPFKHHDEFIRRFETPTQLRDRIFHFSATSLAKLKSKANAESNTRKISTFQSLTALVWRCITRARNLPDGQKTSLWLAADNRARLDPPLPPGYFGNSVNVLNIAITAGELLHRNLGWAAWKIHLLVSSYDDQAVRERIQAWLQSPTIFTLDQVLDSGTVQFGSSPRFEMYGTQFGMGKALAVRSGPANKFGGKIISYPGREGGGSVDLEITMPTDSLSEIASDEEFMAYVSPNHR